MSGHDITSQENNAMFGTPTAWNVFGADGRNWAGYTKEDYAEIGITDFS